MNTLNNNSINYISVGDCSLKCPTCHLPYYFYQFGTAPVETCKCWLNPPLQAPFQMGWKCPICNGGVAPGVERCPCTPIMMTTITTVCTNEYLHNPTITVDEGGKVTLKDKKSKKSSKK